jgi:hypothetical protein
MNQTNQAPKLVKARKTNEGKGVAVIRATRETKPEAQVLPVDFQKAREVLEQQAVLLIEAMLIDADDLPLPEAAKPAKGRKAKPEPSLAEATEAPKLSAIGTVARAMNDALIQGGTYADMAKSVGKPVSMLRSHAKWRTRIGAPWKLEETGDTVKIVATR